MTLHRIQNLLTWSVLAVVAAVSWWILTMPSILLSGAELDVAKFFMHAMMHPADMVTYLTVTAIMWVLMMVAMMVPVALPTGMVFRQVYKGTQINRGTLFFFSGYLLVWFIFAGVAALLQYLGNTMGYMQMEAFALKSILAGWLLILAGLYQLSPMKEVCLRHCQSPLGFFVGNWREGLLGALEMGARHGLYCVGCCWMLMLLMFVGGTMSLLTMSALCLFMLFERTLSGYAAAIPSALMIAAGVVLIIL
jgi:predicted metal-binding membrane protein